MVGAAATLEDPAAAEARAAEEPSAPASGRLPPRLPPRPRLLPRLPPRAAASMSSSLKVKLPTPPPMSAKGSSERWSSSLFFGVDHVFFAGCLFERGRSASVDSDRLLRTASAGSAVLRVVLRLRRVFALLMAGVPGVQDNYAP